MWRFVRMSRIEKKLEFYEDKKVLITGSSGLLGSYLLDLIGAHAREIRVLSRKPATGYRNRIKNIQGDITKGTDTDKIVKDIDIIFHLAAIVNIDKSIRDPFNTIDANVMGTINLLESVRKERNKPHIIFSSSASIYGVSKVKIITEDHTLAPSNPYSASKAAADMICQAYNKTYDIPITILRPSTLYGLRQRRTQFIPTVILQCLSSDTLEIGSLDAYRDFCYVKDAASAFVLAGATAEAKGQVFNISGGLSINVADIVRKISEILRKEVKIIAKKNFYRPCEITSPFVIDSSKAKKILGWVPRYDIDSGLKETVEYFRSSPNKFLKT